MSQRNVTRQERTMRAAWWRLRSWLGGRPNRGAEEELPHPQSPKPRARNAAFLELP
jgi:hypothetical protein